MVSSVRGGDERAGVPGVVCVGVPGSGSGRSAGDRCVRSCRGPGVAGVPGTDVCGGAGVREWPECRVPLCAGLPGSGWGPEEPGTACAGLRGEGSGSVCGNGVEACADVYEAVTRGGQGVAVGRKPLLPVSVDDWV